MPEQQSPATCGHNCGGCSSDCSERTAPAKLTPNSVSTINHVIGVVSGKGGVGKTLVTCMLASELRKRGYSVGILDADVTGPSIPKAFGVKGPLRGTETGINPAITTQDISIISTNLLLPREDDAVAWRGPVLTGIIRQFFNEVNWGKLDYLLVDMPPGTSDAFLTVMQTLPVDGIISVSAPQGLVGMIVGKAINLAKDLDVPVVGLVENMSYFECPDCGKRHSIFGETQVEEIAKHYDIPHTATLPINPSFAAMVDAGKVYDIELNGALDTVIEAI
ncbi:antiporter inner membrane protein [Slackia heliotrinireducens]|uniref:Iron-sulfur cluster carrier protein n=1 Tax=Slackia heliotrinireducens (strain ATCC 29202 / DSM 20476 / NCTC 11029 / RHS 1) TaxID=471855 RepID=C7N4Q3_SLAHD|nr:Mrp/NBP35 family ATP-binding protein [Slackia heliotrinireducens]ACV21888.1 ATPase involved in chromosome partitioning [Slackia heliotrinireducens DSM 20476]VEG99675.1 antiporter inner membrane protein [Slackia heliotrinireducens]